MSAYTNSANWKNEAESYLRSVKDARNLQSMAAMSVLSDAQEQMALGQNIRANFSINVAKYIISMDADEIAEVLA